jgi:pimeloyl-ACP methyl ester carboxylesterase
MNRVPPRGIGRRAASRWIAVLQVALLLVVGVLVGSGAPAVAGPTPASSTPGTVLSAKAATLPTELASLGTAKRVEYVTTDVFGRTTSATGLVITPTTSKKNRTVAWAHGTTGLADQCAPSANQAVFWPEARAAIAELLKRGWTVAAPDYAGLGTPQPHPYLIGYSEARAVIDSVKAARNLDGKLSNQYVIDGHSQGGQAALFASQLAPTYDGSLVLRGTVGIAPVSNVDLIAPYIPGTPNQGYLVMGLYGLATVDSTFNPFSVLAAPAQQQTTVLQSGCLNEILSAYSTLSATDLVNGGMLPQSVIDRLAQWDNPAQSAPSAPILIVQGTADDAVPYDITAGPLLDELHAYSQPVDFVAIDGATHDGAVFDSVTTVADWIAGKFST